jgi:hypothetical protein
MSTAWPGQPPELQLRLAVVRAVTDTLESSVANDTRQRPKDPVNADCVRDSGQQYDMTQGGSQWGDHLICRHCAVTRWIWTERNGTQTA